MPVVLVGPPGVGKSAVGRALAEALGRPFVDTDAAIEADSGLSVAELWAREGEAAFRAREARLMANLPDDVVVASGGGTLTAPGVEALLASGAWRVVALEAPVEVLLERVGRRPGERPLLAASPERRLSALMAERRPLYARAEARFPAVRSPRRVAAEIARYLALSPVPGEVVGRGALAFLRPLLAGRPLLVTEPRVDRLHGPRLRAALGRERLGTVRMPEGERAKRMEAVVRAARVALARGADRDSVFVAAGGGALGDSAGLLAALYMRGVRWAVVPTTLLAMVDASLGGKVAVDLPEGKNLLGAFHPPAASVVDTAFLATLDGARWREGMAESVKAGILGDGDLLERLASATVGPETDDLDEVVRRARAVKRKRVEADPRESAGGVREHLNLGHTLGHALETLSGHRLSHGDAVAIGTAAILRLAEELGLLPPREARPMWAALRRQGLPTEAPPWLDASPAQAAAVMRRDKKARGGAVRLIVPRGVARVEAVAVEEPTLVRLAALAGLGGGAGPFLDTRGRGC
ncbi:MAG: AAA family ATPase [Firmicutes bacterium]|nr:AAA family ATPase [Bacillota bacterium]